MSEPLHIRRVLGSGPFAEIGQPRVAARDDVRGLVAIGGSVGSLYWHGRSLDRWRGYRVGVYGLDDLDCRRLVPSHWPVLDVAFHPDLPLLAVGTGAYDGGYQYEGELLLIDLEKDTVVSALKHCREVRRVRWREDGCALELVVAPCDDDSDDSPETHGFAAVVERDDWRSVIRRGIPSNELLGPRVEAVRRPADVNRVARETVAGLAEARGTSWSLRRQVRAVEQLDDGRVLGVLDGTKLESWLPSGGAEWSLPDPDGARELHVHPDRKSAWVGMHGPNRWVDGTGWEDVPSVVERLSLADGATLDTVEATFPAALTAARDGRIALRNTRHDRPNTPTVLLTPEGTRSAGPALGGYDCVNTFFAVRRSPELLFLQGGKKKYWEDKWVVAVDPVTDGSGKPAVRRLFPLAWDAVRSGHVLGGPAVRLVGGDGTGGALVHAGEIHHSHGPQPDRTFVARRGFPDGLPQWVFTADHPVTALDSDGETVFAAFTSGEVVALDATDGTLRWRTDVTVDGIPTTVLALTASAPGRLLLGTVDGRILVGESS
ncbi:PQQ-binding-like beta-propeller repeat protein [Kitasatospora sp. NPDC018058]|uniref:outer membrane protein assembly factor BamB family protein n=1 Tax=Kitasatospora sp. NPDC018058 TaxID=3364025 RepID=UPI0037C140C4